VLEGAADRTADSNPAFACIVCHPHPLQQGTMQNKVVTTVSRTAARHGGIGVRFNYRGVGASDGGYDGNRGELEDALAAIAGVRATPAWAQLPVVIAGFSFGGAIAYRAALETEAPALITVAPAHQRIPDSAAGALPAWLLVQGSDDEIIPADGVLSWASQHDPMPLIATFEETGHFFHGRLSQLSATVSAYLSDLSL
jgi:alpha/beta superfamily hydrolase